VGSTIATLVEAVLWIAVIGVDDDATASRLKTHGGINDETLSAADTQVGVEEDDGGSVFLLIALRHSDGVVFVVYLGGVS
jgi:hypothetical protein